MNITTQPVSFLPTSAAQPTDVLRRDNTQREVIAPLKPNEAFHRERGLGSDSDRRTPAQERSYAQQLAQARVEAGFPYFIKQVNRQPNDTASQTPLSADDKQPPGEQKHVAQPGVTTTSELGVSNDDLQQALQRSPVQRDDEPLPVRFDSFTESAQGWVPLSTRGSENIWAPVAGAQSATTLTYHDSEGRFETSLSMDTQGATVDQVYLARGQRIEQFYQGSFRPAAHFLLGVA